MRCSSSLHGSALPPVVGDIRPTVIHVKRTHDMQVVKQIMEHPRIWPHIHEDGITEASPVDVEGIHWVLVSNPDPVGLFMAHARSKHCYEMHTCLTPAVWGESGNDAAQLFLLYMFTKTDCQKIVTNVPEYNKAALRFALRNGMRHEGNNRASYLKNGVLIDQYMLGITLKEFESCQQQSQ
ncbi:MAG TPA: GNAT family protein [Nitrososphaera sp.]|nr:GNAT family protein [Nitrososphaera sp.]